MYMKISLEACLGRFSQETSNSRMSGIAAKVKVTLYTYLRCILRVWNWYSRCVDELLQIFGVTFDASQYSVLIDVFQSLLQHFLFHLVVDRSQTTSLCFALFFPGSDWDRFGYCNNHVLLGRGGWSRKDTLNQACTEWKMQRAIESLNLIRHTAE